MENTLGCLKRILVEGLKLKMKPEDISDDSPFFKDGLGLDSIDSLQIMASCEKEFGIQFTDEDLNNSEEFFRNVSALAAFIDKKLSEK